MEKIRREGINLKKEKKKKAKPTVVHNTKGDKSTKYSCDLKIGRAHV